MKKPALVLIPALITLMLTGCGNNSGGSSSTTEEPISTTTGTPTPPQPADQHVTGISVSPSKPFTVQVGDSRKFTVSHEGSPTDQNEKAVTWKVSNDNLASIELVGTSQYFKNAEVTFLAPGKVTITVTSNYDAKFTKSVEVTIIEKNDYTYLWNCTDEDKGKFTKVEPTDGDGQKIPLEEPVVTEDDVELNGLTWHAKRHAAYKDVSGSQYLSFGTKEKCEGQIDFTLVNTKEVKSIEVGVSSAAKVIGKDDKGYDITEDVGSSKLTIKVGETTYLDKGDTANGVNPESLRTPTRDTYASGDVFISFSASVGYINIQYICIRYNHDVYELRLDTSETKTIYEVGETFDPRGLKATALYKYDSNEYDVTDRIVIENTPDLSTLGNKDVNVSFTDEGKKVTATYQISVVAPRIIDSVAIKGDLTTSMYKIGEKISYDGLYVEILYEGGSAETYPIPTKDYGDFVITSVKDIADIDITEAWSISFTFKSRQVSKDFMKGTFKVQSVFDFLEHADELDGYNNYVTLNDAVMSVNVAASANVSQASGYPAVKDKHSIFIKSFDTNVSIKHVDFEMIPYVTSGGTPEAKTGTIKISSSIFGQAPYDIEIGSHTIAKDDREKFMISDTVELEKGVNALEISFSNTNNFGIVCLTIELTKKEHALAESLSYVGSLEKSEYKVGEDFDPTGLEFSVSFSNGYETKTVSNPKENILWEPLIEGMTSIKGTFLNVQCEISGISVSKYQPVMYTKLTSELEDYSGRYLIVAIDSAVALNGSLTTSNDLKGDDNDIDVNLSEDKLTITGDLEVDKAYFDVKKESDGNYSIKSSFGFYISVTASGGMSATSSKNKVSLELDSNGNVIISNKNNTSITKEGQYVYDSTKGKFTTAPSVDESNLAITLYRAQ